MALPTLEIIGIFIAVISVILLLAIMIRIGFKWHNEYLYDEELKKWDDENTDDK